MDTNPANQTPDCRLYLITPPQIDLGTFPDLFSAALDGGDVASVQLRLKDVDDGTVKRATDILMPIAHARDVAFLVNDRPDLAAETGADGCHVGQEDASYADARRLLGPDAIVGVTCHNSRHLAMEAGDAGADYVAFGAFFPTETKAAKTRADIDLLSWWTDLATVPVVAIGGITQENCRPLIAAGADFLAVVGAVWAYPEGPGRAVAAFNRICIESADLRHGAAQT